MDEQIARHARAVIAVAAPAKEPLRIPICFGSPALKTLPIASARIRIWRNRVLPRTNGRVPIPPRFDYYYFGARAGAIQFLPFFVDYGTPPLAAYLHDSAGLLLSFGDSQSVTNMLHH